MTLKKKLEDKKTITVVYVPYLEFYTINHRGSNTVYKLPLCIFYRCFQERR